MLHRLMLRVLPSLSLAVTDTEVRKRKRWVMIILGLVAFVIYRAAKVVLPLSDPRILLAFSGLVSACIALYAYRAGRQHNLARIWREDGTHRLGWLVGWIGFAYGVQLSLLVLTILRIVVGYDFLQHPEGPAMLAIIISCTSVARDAFEIGHLRSLELIGKPLPTFPDGAMLRRFLIQRIGLAGQWLVGGALIVGFVALTVATIGNLGRHPLVQLLTVTVVAGSLALVAYLAGHRPREWSARFREGNWAELLRFWWWPGLTFAATYYFVLIGLVVYVLRHSPTQQGMLAVLAGVVGGMLALYCLFLGVRRAEEDRIRQEVPSSLLRCPFVMGILSQSRGTTGTSPVAQTAQSSDVALEQSGQSR